MAGNDERFDVAIIGGGVVGCATARVLSRYDLSVCLLEAQEDLGYGTSKANSGIVHAGHHSSPSMLKGQFVVKGNAMFDQLQQELHFGFKRVGEIVIAQTPEDLIALEEMKKVGEAKGVPGLEMWDQERLRKEEPHLSEHLLGGCYAPSAGVVNSYEVVMTLAESAVKNGVVVLVNSTVESIELDESDLESHTYTIKTSNHCIQSRFVINAAGLFADMVEQMVGLHTFDIRPRKGEEYLLDKSVANLTKRIVFPVPGKVSKGILIIPTVDGTTMVGPTAVETEDRHDLTTTADGMRAVFTTVSKYCPEISQRDVIASFAGLRAASDTGDFILGLPDEKKRPGFINCAGIQSPGLTSAPALAEHLAKVLSENGLKLVPKDNFDPYIEPLAKFFELSEEEQIELTLKNSFFSRVVCRCELVTEGDIHQAISHGARSLDGVKFRTRAGMGRCQGGFCTHRILQILSQRLNVPIAEVTKRGGTSRLIFNDIEDTNELKENPSSYSDVLAEQKNLSLKYAQRLATFAAAKIDESRTYDVSIIGAGPAGLAAGTGARKEGADVIILDREATAGGILLQCIHSGFGLKHFKEELTGPEYAERSLAIALESGVQIVPDSFVNAMKKEDGLYSLRVLSGRDGEVKTVKSKSVVLAMGCRERTRSAIGIAGSRPAGIYTAGLAQKLVNEQGFFPGKRCVILGSGDIGLIMARRMTLEGCTVVGVFEIMPYCNGLNRNVVQCLHDYHIPLHLAHTVVKIHGKGRLERVTIAPVDGFVPDMSRAYDVECDTLLLSVGLIPENELSLNAGIGLDPSTKGPNVNSTLMTDHDGVFACGNVLHVHDIVDNVTAESLVAGRNAAMFAKGVLHEQEKGETLEVVAGENLGYILPKTINTAHDQRLNFRVRKHMQPAKIVIRSGDKVVMEKKEKIVLPAEMVQVDVKSKLLVDVKSPLVVSVEVAPAPSRKVKELGEAGEGVEETVYTCVGCPKGCQLHVRHKGKEVIDVAGFECRRGFLYAKQEHVDPRRGFSTTIRVDGSPIAVRLPVKLSAPLPKASILSAANAIHSMIVSPPIKVGQVLAKDLVGCEGVNVVSCRTVDSPEELIALTKGAIAHEEVVLPSQD